MKRKEISKEELKTLYIDRNLSSVEVCELLNIDKSTFFRKIKKDNLKKK